MAPTEGTWGAGYVMVPGWLLARKPSANALMLYTHLAMHGRFDHATGTYEECRPSIRRLSTGDPRSGYPGTGMSPSTINRALRELVELGAIAGRPAYDRRGGQLPTIYRVMFGRIAPPTSDTPPLSPVTDNPEPSIQNQVPTCPPTPRTKPAGAAVAEQAGRQEEEGKDQAATTDPATDRAAAELVDGLVWPTTLQPNQRTMTTLRRYAAACLAAGHHPAAVREQALDAMPGAKTAGSVVARLRDLATRTPDPAVAAAAEREAAKQARERLGRTPHQWVNDPRRPSYCGACGRPRATHPAEPQDQERVDQSEAPDTGQAPPRRCQHGRRVCVTCHGGRDREDTTTTTSAGDRQRPAPRQRPAADPDPAPVSGPTPAGQEFHRALAAMAGRMVAA